MVKTNDQPTQRMVVEILENLPDTDNTDVHAKVAEIGVLLPATQARRLASLVEQGLRKRYQVFLPHRALGFATHLAKSGCVAEANGIVRLVFGFEPDPNPPKAVEGLSFRPTPQARRFSSRQIRRKRPRPLRLFWRRSFDSRGGRAMKKPYTATRSSCFFGSERP
jgi:hypothetical protein